MNNLIPLLSVSQAFRQMKFVGGSDDGFQATPGLSLITMALVCQGHVGASWKASEG